MFGTAGAMYFSVCAHFGKRNHNSEDGECVIAWLRNESQIHANANHGQADINIYFLIRTTISLELTFAKFI